MLKNLQHCLKKSRNRTVLFNLTAGGIFSIQILGDISISCPFKSGCKQDAWIPI